MPSIPLPFVVALLLAILFVRVLIQDGGRLRPTSVFIATCTVLVTTVGLRWTVDLQWTRFLQPVVAALLPPIAWLCFSQLNAAQGRRYWPHLLVPASILVLSLTWQQWHPPIDLILALVYFGYSAALVHGIYAGHGEFESTRLVDTAEARKAVLVVAGLLSTSGVIDLLIAADFGLYQGNHAASIVAAAHVLTLPVIAGTIAVMSRSVPEDDADVEDISTETTARASEAVRTTDDHRHVMQGIDRLMDERKLYRDPDLTLERLARRLGMPARQISSAVNRAASRNVSQIVNEYRIREAMRLLRETDLPVTSIMFEAGFQTKSNFNREFLRVVGASPREFRLSRETDAKLPNGPTAGPARLQPESR